MATAAAATTTTTVDMEVGERTPLVNGDDEVLKDLPESTKKEKAVAGLAVVSFVASVASIVFISNPVTYISGILGAIMSPYAAIQQRKITDVDALSETNQRRKCSKCSVLPNESSRHIPLSSSHLTRQLSLFPALSMYAFTVKEEVDQLKGENDKLEAQVSTLSTSVDGLKQSKEKLDIIQSVQGQSLTELEQQLVESRKILGSMQDSLIGDILQNLMTVVLAADDNGDMLLSDIEIEELVTNFENLQGLDLDNETIKKVIVGKGRSVAALMDMVKVLLTSKDLASVIQQFKQDAAKVDRGISIEVSK